jgi:hypothetical protein
MKLSFALCPLLAITMISSSCKQDDEQYVSSPTYKNVVYAMDSNEPEVEITYSVAVYGDAVKGNIDEDSVITNAGFTQIPAAILVGENARMYAVSYSGGDFSLQIRDDQGNVLAQSDSVAFDPANQLHPDRYYTSIMYRP